MQIQELIQLKVASAMTMMPSLVVKKREKLSCILLPDWWRCFYGVLFFVVE